MGRVLSLNHYWQFGYQPPDGECAQVLAVELLVAVAKLGMAALAPERGIVTPCLFQSDLREDEAKTGRILRS